MPLYTSMCLHTCECDNVFPCVHVCLHMCRCDCVSKDTWVSTCLNMCKCALCVCAHVCHVCVSVTMCEQVCVCVCALA